MCLILVDHNLDIQGTRWEKVQREIVTAANCSIDTLSLSPNTFRALLRKGIHTVGELLSINYSPLLIRGIGSANIGEICKALHYKNYSVRGTVWEMS